MIAQKFEKTNLLLGAGNNPNTIDLPVAIAENEQTPDVAYVISKWTMTEEEREEFQRTGEIYLCVMAHRPSDEDIAKLEKDPGHKLDRYPTAPPVLISPLNPFKELGYKSFLYPIIKPES